MTAVNDGSPIPTSRQGISAVSGAVTLMGIGSVVAKAASMDGPLLAFHRAWVAAVLYLAVLVAIGGGITVKKLRAAAPGGLVFGLQLAFFFSAIQLTTVANATMLIALQPIVIMAFFSRRFGETTARREWMLSAVALVGVALVIFGSSSAPSWSPEGDLLGVCALFTWTLYFVYSKQARQTLGAFEYQGLSLFFSAMVVLPIAFAFNGTLAPGSGKWPWVLAMVATPGTGHLLMNWAHARVPLGLVSQMTLVSPVISVALAAVLLEGETVNLTQLVGMGIVLGALAQILRGKSA